MHKVKKILIVDDDADILSVLQESISEINFVEILSAQDGMEALKILEKNKIDLLITDIRMPNLDGISLILEVRKNYPTPPIIISTGNQDTLKESKQLDVDGFFEKPFKMNDLISCVEKLLAMKELEQK